MMKTEPTKFVLYRGCFLDTYYHSQKPIFFKWLFVGMILGVMFLSGFALLV
jgi:hypothetical protein